MLVHLCDPVGFFKWVKTMGGQGRHLHGNQPYWYVTSRVKGIHVRNLGKFGLQTAPHWRDASLYADRI